MNMATYPVHGSIETLFDSVEIELVRRWAIGQVPAIFGQRPPAVLKCFVKAWWHLYHESRCAATAQNRTLWVRPGDPIVQVLTTDTLIGSLLQIRQLIDVNALTAFRPVVLHEEYAVAGLEILIHFFHRQKQLA